MTTKVMRMRRNSAAGASGSKATALCTLWLWLITTWSAAPGVRQWANHYLRDCH